LEELIMRNVVNRFLAGLFAVFILADASGAGLFGVGIGDSSSLQPAVPPNLKVVSTKARATTDVSDLWWNPNESGWGMQLVQNNDFVFATLFVYGPDGMPTWYTAQLNRGAGFTWTGPLFTTTGPWFAMPAFNPGQVGIRQVGNLTFQALSVASGALTYTVDGLAVSKSVIRQTLVNEAIGGVYDVVISQVQTCSPPLSSGTFTGRFTFNVSQVGNNVVGVTTNAAGGVCTLTGTYTQFGKMGSVGGDYSCATGENGVFNLFEIVVTETGMLARLTEQSNFCSSISASAAGIRQ
jgi:hypothetical protein